jgi:hypothetical protein
MHRGYSRPQTWVALLSVALHKQDVNPHLQKPTVCKTLQYPKAGFFPEFFDGKDSDIKTICANNSVLKQILDILRPISLEPNFDMRHGSILSLIQDKQASQIDFEKWLCTAEPDCPNEATICCMAYWRYRMERIFGRPIFLPPRFLRFGQSVAPEILEEQVVPVSALAQQVFQTIQQPPTTAVPLASNVCRTRNVTPMDATPPTLQPKQEPADVPMAEAPSTPPALLQVGPPSLILPSTSVSSGLFGTSTLPPLLTFPPSLSPIPNIPRNTGEFFRFAPVHQIGPKSYDWSTKFHIYDPQHKHFIMVRANNDGPYGLVGITADYIFERDYVMGGCSLPKHVPVTINPNTKT